MIHVACLGFYDALQFHLEEEGAQPAEGDAALHDQRVDVPVALPPQQLDDAALFVRQFLEEAALHGGGGRTGRAPVHGLHEVFGALQQGGLVVADEPVAPRRVFVGGAARHGEAVALVALGQRGGDERAAFASRFHDDDGVGHARHDAVAAEEVVAFRLRAGQEFGQQAALGQHVGSRLAVDGGVDAVQAVGQYGDSGHAVGQGGAVGGDVDAVGQSADHQQVGTAGGEVAHKLVAPLPAIIRGAAGAHHADYTEAVQIGLSAVEEEERGVLAFAEAGGVAFVAEGEAGDAVLLGKGQFLLGTGKDARGVEGFQGGGLDVGADVG